MTSKRKINKTAATKHGSTATTTATSIKMDHKKAATNCMQCGNKYTTPAMFILIMLGLLGSFYYFQQILENNFEGLNIQGRCGLISKMVMELNTKVAALAPSLGSQADRAMETKLTTEMESSTKKYNIIKTSFQIKALVDSSTNYSKEQTTLNDFLKNSFINEQNIINNYKAQSLTPDQNLINILSKDINKPGEIKHETSETKSSIIKIFKVKKAEENIMEQSFTNNINMAIVKILSHDYAEAVKYVEYNAHRPDSYNAVIEALKAKAQVKAALDKIINTTLQN